MTESEKEAADHLRTIRALMERATVYQAISAPTALAAGITTLVLCYVLAGMERTQRPGTIGFTGLWLAVLLIMTALNFWLLYRSARRRGEAFASSGMKMALQAIAPPLGAGFALGFLTAAYRPAGYADIVSYWILFYGLGLLAMRSFAPRPLVMLGVGFFTLGIVSFLPDLRIILPWVDDLKVAAPRPPFERGILWMGISFGLLHVIYAVAVFRSSRKKSSLTSPETS